MPRLRLLLLLLLLATAGLAPRCPFVWITARVHTADAAVWARFETRGALGFGVENLYDAALADVEGEFMAPDGRIWRMPGFVHREYDRALVGGFEKLTPRGDAFLAVRFTPTQPGGWRWRWRVSLPGGFSVPTPWHPFDVAPPRAEAHGFLHPSPLDPRYLRHDDGTPFLAIGENLAWYDGRGTFAYDDWISELAAVGANYARLWMPSWAFGLEWLVRDPTSGDVVESQLGRYDGRLDRAWQLDQVIEALEQSGIHVMLNLQNHGPFTFTANTQWVDNPYAESNGGPLADPGEVFTNEEARRLFRQRFRYVVARWGYSPAILAWELWNEVDFVPGAGGPDARDWHAEMAEWLRELDPHDRMVTTSLSNAPLPPPLLTDPSNELLQVHQYMWPLFVDVAGTLAAFVDLYRQPGRPILVSEFGVDFRGPGETRAEDPEAVGFHDGLWGPLLSGTMGTGMTWWWDNVIDPDDLYPHLGAVAAFTDGIAFDEQGFAVLRPPVQAPGRTLGAYALAGPDTALVWIKNLEHQWWPPGGAALDPSDVLGATLALPELAPGTWRVRWYDTYSGVSAAAPDLGVGPGGALVTVPTFARDTALRLERLP